MDVTNASAVTDPSEWTQTRLPALQQLDAFLRCQICKDFLTSAVITSCSHTFCSLCIRRCLAAEGRCPSCRTTEQETRLRRNVAVQEATDAFVGSRDQMIQLAREQRDNNRPSRDVYENNESVRQTRGSKRKRAQEDVDGPAPQAPRTRSQRQAALQKDVPTSCANDLPTHSAPIADSDDDDATYEPRQSHPQDVQGIQTSQPNDGLVACPICGKRMKEEQVFPHTDICNGNPTSSPPRRPPSSQSKGSLQNPLRPSRETRPPPERLPQINYSLLRDQALKKKLSDLGIPNWGSRALLIRRHSEWLALWNANCDSKFPRSKKELLGELDKWERSQGGYAPAGSSVGGGNWPSGPAGSSMDRTGDRGFTSAANIMQKDFNSVQWSNNNRDEFKELIKKAKERKDTGNTDRQHGDHSDNAERPQDEGKSNSGEGGRCISEIVDEKHPKSEDAGHRGDHLDVGSTGAKDPAHVERMWFASPPTLRQGRSNPAALHSDSDLAWMPSNDAININLEAARRASSSHPAAPSSGGTPTNLFSTSNELSPVKQKPMFEMPAEPVVDSEVSGAR